MHSWRTIRWLVAFIGLLFDPSALGAHGIVGPRMFIEPLFAEDANIKNEIDLPRAEFLPVSDGSDRSVAVAVEKALYPDRWSIILEQSWVSHYTGAVQASGFEDLEIGTKVGAYRNERHEFLLTPSFFFAVPTGSRTVADRQTTLQPAVLFAKGLGDLDIGWFRPVAVQGDIGYEMSAGGEQERRLNYDMVVEYSFPYLNRYIRNADAGFDLEHNLRLGRSPRAIAGDLFAFIEFNGSSPAGRTLGSTVTFLRPGALYMAKYFQLGAAASIPLRGSSPGQHAGAVVLLDFFLDEIVPVLDWTPFGRSHHR